MQALRRAGGLDEVLDELIQRTALAEFARSHGMRRRRPAGRQRAAPRSPHSAGPTAISTDDAFPPALAPARADRGGGARGPRARACSPRQLLVPVAFGAGHARRASAGDMPRCCASSAKGAIALLPSSPLSRPTAPPTDAAAAARSTRANRDRLHPARAARDPLRQRSATRRSATCRRRPTPQISQRYQRDRAAVCGDRAPQLHPARRADRRTPRSAIVGRSARRQVARRRGAREGPAASTRRPVTRAAARRPRPRPRWRRRPSPRAQGALAAPARGGLGWYVLRVDAIDRQARRARSTQVRGEIAAAARRRAAPRRAGRSHRADRGRVRRGRQPRRRRARPRARRSSRTRPLTADGQVYGTAERDRAADPRAACSRPRSRWREQRAAARRSRRRARRFVVFDVADITPSAAAPLTRSATDVTAAWRARRRAPRRARAAADRILARVARGSSLAEAVAPRRAAAAARREPIDAQPRAARRAGPACPPQLALFFSMAEGTAKKLEAPGDAGWFVVQLDRHRCRRRSPRTTRSCSPRCSQLGQVDRATNTSSSSSTRCAGRGRRRAQPDGDRRGRRAQLTGQRQLRRTVAWPARCPRTPPTAQRARLPRAEPALVWRKLIADTETPVGAALKLIEPGRGDFLLELVEGGEVRGRYSLLGLDPDLVFRATGHACEINRALAPRPRRRSSRCPATASPSCARWSTPAASTCPTALPPALACLVGYFGYETIGLVEKLPRAPQSELDAARHAVRAARR